MPDSDSTYCHHPSLLKNSGRGLSIKKATPTSADTVGQEGGGDGVCSYFPVLTNCRDCSRKMLTCRVLLVLLLVKCLILSFIIPAHLSPTTSSSEYPPPSPDYEHSGRNGEPSDDSHQMMSSGDGFDNNNMMDDQPLSLSFKTEIKNLVETFDIPSQSVTSSDTNAEDHASPPTNGDDDGAAEAVAPAGDDDDTDSDGGNSKDEGTDPATSAQGTDSESTSGNDGEPGSNAEGDDDTESQVENAVEAAEESQTEAESNDSSATSSETTASDEAKPAESCIPSKANNPGSSESSGGTMDIKTVLAKIENLMDAVKNIDANIDKMETLVQSTMIDERIYKCISAITNGNQTQALKYWKQILRYLSTPQKQAAIMNQLIRESYSGSEEHIPKVIQFIDQTTQYYGYYTLFKELPKYDQLYRNTAIFTLAHYAKKSCGRDSVLYKSLPGAVQAIFSDFFTLQNKHNKGYLYYAKRCVSKHYSYCLDVLTKRIDPYVLEGLADDSEEKKRFHWRLNATDTTVSKFFILNLDKYWTYRLQDLNNSPRFKMEEAGSNAEVELAHFRLKLHTDDEIMIQVRDSEEHGGEDYLEEEDLKAKNPDAPRLHSFHKAEGTPDSPRIFWLVNPVASTGGENGFHEPDSCNIELASVTSANGNGNGSNN